MNKADAAVEINGIEGVEVVNLPLVTGTPENSWFDEVPESVRGAIQEVFNDREQKRKERLDFLFGSEDFLELETIIAELEMPSEKDLMKLMQNRMRREGDFVVRVRQWLKTIQLEDLIDNLKYFLPRDWIYPLSDLNDYLFDVELSSDERVLFEKTDLGVKVGEFVSLCERCFRKKIFEMGDDAKDLHESDLPLMTDFEIESLVEGIFDEYTEKGLAHLIQLLETDEFFDPEKIADFLEVFIGKFRVIDQKDVYEKFDRYSVGVRDWFVLFFQKSQERRWGILQKGPWEKICVSLNNFVVRLKSMLEAKMA